MCVFSQLSRIDQEGGDPDARVHLRDPVAGPLRAEPLARLRLRPLVADPPRAQPHARHHLRAPAAGPDSREAGLPRRRRHRAVAPGKGGWEGEPPRHGSVAPGKGGGLEGGGRACGARPRRAGQGGVARRRPALRAGQALRPLLGATEREAQAQARLPLRRRRVGGGGRGGHGRGSLRRRRALQAPRRQEGIHRRWRRVRAEVHAGRRLRGRPGRRPGTEVLPEEQQGDEEGHRRVGCRACCRQGEEGQPQVVGSPDLRLQCVIGIV
uniref:Uncharacterized protein n=1 Tax=Arundo donax TaxID=35708 RepID=A0A0A9D2U1_ARUDO